jgi:hypothetical protein
MHVCIVYAAIARDPCTVTAAVLLLLGAFVLASYTYMAFSCTDRALCFVWRMLGSRLIVYCPVTFTQTTPTGVTSLPVQTFNKLAGFSSHHGSMTHDGTALAQPALLPTLLSEV